MTILGTTRLIGLIGDPVSHSLSPAMHNPAFEHNGIDFAYVPLRVRHADLKSAVEALRIFNFRGANVTLPHKEAVIPFLDELSDISRLMGVVNTIVNDNGRLLGTTTDPHGFLEGFRMAGHSFEGKSVAIFGNGGSARSIVFALLTMDKPSRVVLVGRDVAKAKKLALEITATLANQIQAPFAPILEFAALSEYAALSPNIQIIVNATPLGMHPNIGSSPLQAGDFHTGQIVYDIVYVPEQTCLIQLAQDFGLKTVGGLGMLVHQGLASFEVWTGTTPDVTQFFASAREQLERSGRPDDHKPTPISGLDTLKNF